MAKTRRFSGTDQEHVDAADEFIFRARQALDEAKQSVTCRRRYTKLMEMNRFFSKADAHLVTIESSAEHQRIKNDIDRLYNDSQRTTFPDDCLRKKP
jgi:hypothetical protein